jgi:hypothetical protein
MELDRKESLHNYIFPRNIHNVSVLLEMGKLKEQVIPIIIITTKKLSSFNNEELTCNMGKQECKPIVYLCD